MRPTTSDQIREAFLEFFEEHGHRRVPSSSLIPYNDKTILLTNAGMVQFKDVFLGLETRPYTRATTAQKCMRVSGKHNDLENVGPSPRHHTFFEMLGNFSFGDYFKAEAIRYAYEFLTGVLELDPDRLYYTVHTEDDVAFRIWTEDMGIDPARVHRMGDKTNFWSMGDVGPCGPTSEIHYDWGPQACTCGRPDCSVALDNGCERWLEIWNLVFMQFNQDADGRRTPLPRPGIDTGMGLERIAGVVQGTPINYETDLFRPILDHVQRLCGHSDEERRRHTVAYRVIADHARAAAFLVADGVRPGPTGAGSVARTVIRRAFYYGRRIGFDGPFLARVTDAVVERMGHVYPELRQRQALITRVVTQEEEQFLITLERGQRELDRRLSELSARGRAVLPGEEAFNLKSTYGFPIQLTRDICHERGIEVDMAGYERAEAEHRLKSKAGAAPVVFAAGAEPYVAALDRLQDSGLLPDDGVLYDPYSALRRSTHVVALLTPEGMVESATGEVELVLAETPFYATAGGQVADTGRIVGADWEATVLDVSRPVTGLIVHRCQVTKGVAKAGTPVEAVVDAERRHHIMRNHTATHLLHEALRMHLGRDVQQRGSLVAPDRLRFDFSYDAALTSDQIEQIVLTVNQAILAAYPVRIAFKPLEQALAEGATALFGEKYGDEVRTIQLGENGVFWSYELCGGTHVANTAHIGSFYIVSEGSVGGGVRRIEAVTGLGAVTWASQHRRLLERMGRDFNVAPENVPQKVADLKAQVAGLTREVQRLRQQLLAKQAAALAADVRMVDGIKVLARRVEATDIEDMRVMADDLRNRLGTGIVVLGAVLNDRPTIIAAATADVVARGFQADRLVRALGPIIGGGGGGRSDMAQAGGKDPARLDAALAAVFEQIAHLLPT
ncbi:MAG: alanine--tRNA ligase [Caldilineales bacterium]|nr:alanine--tRNA ligase [Caldilineales bacterium]